MFDKIKRDYLKENFDKIDLSKCLKDEVLVKIKSISIQKIEDEILNNLDKYLDEGIDIFRYKMTNIGEDIDNNILKKYVDVKKLNSLVESKYNEEIAILEYYENKWEDDIIEDIDMKKVSILDLKLSEAKNQNNSLSNDNNKIKEHDDLEL